MDTGLNAVKTTSKKVIHKAGKFIGNKVADAVTNSNDYDIEKQELFEEIIIPPEKKRWNTKQIEKKHYKNATLWNI